VISNKEIYGEDIESIQGAFPDNYSDRTFPEGDIECAAHIDYKVSRHHREYTPASDDG
jgi:hypothetical protein